MSLCSTLSRIQPWLIERKVPSQKIKIQSHYYDSISLYWLYMNKCVCVRSNCNLLYFGRRLWSVHRVVARVHKHSRKQQSQHTADYRRNTHVGKHSTGNGPWHWQWPVALADGCHQLRNIHSESLHPATHPSLGTLPCQLKQRRARCPARTLGSQTQNPRGQWLCAMISIYVRFIQHITQLGWCNYRWNKDNVLFVSVVCVFAPFYARTKSVGPSLKFQM